MTGHSAPKEPVPRDDYRGPGSKYPRKPCDRPCSTGMPDLSGWEFKALETLNVICAPIFLFMIIKALLSDHWGCH